MDVDGFRLAGGPPFAPSFLKALTNSFFLVSTETTGRWRPRKAVIWSFK